MQLLNSIVKCVRNFFLQPIALLQIIIAEWLLYSRFQSIRTISNNFITACYTALLLFAALYCTTMHFGTMHYFQKPENILCGVQMEDLKISDFGLSEVKELFISHSAVYDTPFVPPCRTHHKLALSAALT